MFERSPETGGCIKAARHATWLGATIAAVVMVWPIIIQADSMKFIPYSDKAIVQAVSEHKPVMIDFTAEWCPSCKELDRKTFPNQKVKVEGERFVRLQADVTADKSTEVRALKQKYNVQGPPTIIFLDSKGDEVKDIRIIGFVKPDKLIEAMRTVK
jgi:thiol:disulfide interchange protein DsbD